MSTPTYESAMRNQAEWGTPQESLYGQTLELNMMRAWGTPLYVESIPHFLGFTGNFGTIYTAAYPVYQTGGFAGDISIKESPYLDSPAAWQQKYRY